MFYRCCPYGATFSRMDRTRSPARVVHMDRLQGWPHARPVNRHFKWVLVMGTLHGYSEWILYVPPSSTWSSAGCILDAGYGRSGASAMMHPGVTMGCGMETWRHADADLLRWTFPMEMRTFFLGCSIWSGSYSGCTWDAADGPGTTYIHRLRYCHGGTCGCSTWTAYLEVPYGYHTRLFYCSTIDIFRSSSTFHHSYRPICPAAWTSYLHGSGTWRVGRYIYVPWGPLRRSHLLRLLAALRAHRHGQLLGGRGKQRCDRKGHGAGAAAAAQPGPGCPTVEARTFTWTFYDHSRYHVLILRMDILHG
jgi:hypothetical protein